MDLSNAEQGCLLSLKQATVSSPMTGFVIRLLLLEQSESTLGQIYSEFYYFLKLKGSSDVESDAGKKVAHELCDFVAYAVLAIKGLRGVTSDDLYNYRCFVDKHFPLTFESTQSLNPQS